MNRITSLLTIAAACLTLAACSSKSDDSNTESNSSQGYVMTSSGLIRQANEALAAADYDLAKQLADSVHKAYPTDIEGRKTAMHLSCKAKEGIINKNLQQADSLLKKAEASGDAAAINKARALQSRYQKMLNIARDQVTRTAPQNN